MPPPLFFRDSSVETAATVCERDCILGITNTYIAALVTHDPVAAPLAENIALVENIKKMSPGEGLWESIVAGPDSFAIYVSDEVNQAAGYMGMMRYLAVPPSPGGITPEERAEWTAASEKVEQPVLVALRLKLEDGKIVEAEHLLAGIRETVNNDPNSPFAEDCQRHENGMVTAGAEAGAGPNNAGTGEIARDCIGQLDSKVMSYITIENRRMFAADPATGLSMGLSHFTHPMDNMPYEVINFKLLISICCIYPEIPQRELISQHDNVQGRYYVQHVHR